MTQMTNDEAMWIRHTFVEYRTLLVSEMARHPGAPLDDLDMDSIDEIMRRIKRHGYTGLRIAHYEVGYKPGDRIYWVNGAQNLLRWIRDQRFRPKYHEVEQEAERLEMIARTVDLTGETAQQRRVVEAPRDYKELAAKASDGLLGMPEAQMPEDIPSWLSRFPATGDAGYDAVIMNCLLHCTEGKAHATIDQMLRDNEAKARRSDDRSKAAARRETIKLENRSTSSAAARMLAVYRNEYAK
jgi:hypothetical protein